ncbi:MAG: ribosome-binding factor A [Patescibacteria group bacterium]
MAFRQEKVSSVLKNIIASFLQSDPFYGIIISVTRIEISGDLKKAKVFISIFPSEKEKEILDSLHKKRNDLREFIKSRLKMKFLPHLEIEIDKGEKARQKIDKILKEAR